MRTENYLSPTLHHIGLIFYSRLNRNYSAVDFQAQSPSGSWGEWSPSYFATTRSTMEGPIPGKLRLLSASHDNLRVNWTPPPDVRNVVDQYLVRFASFNARE